MRRERKNEGKGEGGTVWTNDRPCSKIFSVEIEITKRQTSSTKKVKYLKYA